MVLDFEDLDVFFVNGEFAQEVTLDPDGTPSTITAIFDNGYSAVDLRDGLVLSDSTPMLHCKAPDVAGVTVGMTNPTEIEIAGTRYVPIERRQDVSGQIVILILQEV